MATAAKVISDLPVNAGLVGTELVELQVGSGAGSSQQVTVAKLAKFAPASTALTISAGAITIDCSLSRVFTLTLTASVTSVTFTNVPASGTPFFGILKIAQDATGGRTIAWPAAVKWSGGTYVASTAINAVDTVGLMTVDGGTSWQGVYNKAFA